MHESEDVRNPTQPTEPVVAASSLDDPVSNDDVRAEESGDATASFPGADAGEAASTEGPLELGAVGELGTEALELERSVILCERAVEESSEPPYLLDAWYAEYGDPTGEALLRRELRERGNLDEFIAEVVIGTDDRLRIDPASAYPWRAICSLLITARDRSRWIGTGWLVGERTLVTAGHVVYIHSRGGWVRSIEVIPGRNAAERPFGSCTATAFRSVRGWTEDRNRDYDYAAIILPESCPKGREVGWLGFANLDTETLERLTVNLSGYPGDKPPGTQWWHARRLTDVEPRTIVYNIDTAGGQSGAPVWRLRNGQRHAVGIHTNGFVGGNSATRISRPVYENLVRWKQEGD